MDAKRFGVAWAVLLISTLAFAGCEDSGNAANSDGGGTDTGSQEGTDSETMADSSDAGSGEGGSETEIDTGTDTGSSDDGGFDLEITAETLCAEVARVMCHNMFACCTSQEIKAELGVELAPSETECRRDMKLHCELSWVELFFALDAGTVILDSTSAEECFSRYVAPKDGCFLLSKTPFDSDACGDWIEGNQAIGESCLEDYECGDENAFCGVNGVCTPYALEGEMCSSTVGCAPDLYWLNAGNKPRQGTCNVPSECRRYLQEDESCRPWRGDHCASGLSCQDYSSAWPNEPSPGTCQPAHKKAGEPCTANAECISNECIPGICGDGRTCFTDGDCRGTCTFDPIPCSNDADCSGVASRCELADNPCSSNLECGLSHCVSNPSQICGTFEFPNCPAYCSKSGKPCNMPSDCGKVCEGDPGFTPCNSNADCAGTCLLGRGSCQGDENCPQGDICIPTPCVAEGTCEADECRADRCVSSVCEGASSCQGPPTCAEKLHQIDYCELGLSLGNASFL